MSAALQTYAAEMWSLLNELRMSLYETSDGKDPWIEHIAAVLQKNEQPDVADVSRLPLTHVACKDTEGRVWSLPRPFRHHNVFAVMRDHGAKPAEDGHFSQGFLDSSGIYLHRKAAYRNAHLNKQIKGGSIIGGVLTSEDLW